MKDARAPERFRPPSVRHGWQLWRGLGVARLLRASEGGRPSPRIRSGDGIRQRRRAIEEVLGYNGGRLRPSESAARAAELMARFRKYAARHGVDLVAAGAASRLMMWRAMTRR